MSSVGLLAISLCFIFWGAGSKVCNVTSLTYCIVPQVKNLTLGCFCPPSFCCSLTHFTYTCYKPQTTLLLLKKNQLSFNEIWKLRTSFIFMYFRFPSFIALCSSEFASAIIFLLSQERYLGPLAIHFFSFYLCGTVLISSWFLKDVFTGCRVLGWLFFFSTLEMLCCGQACLVPDEKCALVLFLFPRM